MTVLCGFSEAPVRDWVDVEMAGEPPLGIGGCGLAICFGRLVSESRVEDPKELPLNQGHTLRTVGGLFGEHPEKQSVEGRGHTIELPRDGVGLSGAVEPEVLLRSLRTERRCSREQLVEEDPHPIGVGAVIHLGAGDLLWRHIRIGAHDVTDLGEVRELLEPLHHAEVNELDDPGLRDEHIARL